jgi:acyl-CoA synthetase (NDP forming)
VLTVHAGRSAPGQRAAASHTAAIAAPLITREALFEQAGIIATAGLGELVDVAALLAAQPPQAGGRVAIISNARGPGMLAADACTGASLTVHTVTPGTQRRLQAILPVDAVVTGPVGTTAAVSAEAFRPSLETLAADVGVGAVLAIIAPSALADLVPAVRAARLTVPVAAVILNQGVAVRLLPGDHGRRPVPAYAYPEHAARALGRAARYGSWLVRPAGIVPELDRIHAADARGCSPPSCGAFPAEAGCRPPRPVTCCSATGSR